jgi:hypothetical protein
VYKSGTPHRLGASIAASHPSSAFINMWGSKLKSLALAISLLSPAALAGLTPGTEKCKGYSAANVKKTGSSLSADLNLIGAGCGIYGEDLKQLKLEVNYDTGEFSGLLEELRICF